MEREILWYDIEKKQMLKFKGERLEFKYAQDLSLDKPKFRLIPKVVSSIQQKAPIVKKVASSRIVTVTIESTESAAQIHKWFKKYQLRNPTDAEVDITSGKTVDFTFPLEEAEDFLTDAKKNGLTFEV